MAPAIGIGLRPVDPHDVSDIEELRRQRTLCGWDEDQISRNMEAVSAGDMFYFLFHFANDPHTIIGSGGLDLNGVQNGESMCSHKSSEFCVMGMFLYERYRGKGLFRPMSEALLDYGYIKLNLRSATVMTNDKNPVTNHLFMDFGFEEFYREPKPYWFHKGCWGIQYRLSREKWLSLTQAQGHEP